MQLADRDLRIAESIAHILLGSMGRISQWMGNLFYRGVALLEIKGMEYSELKYWNDWHDRIGQAEEDAVKAAQDKGKNK